jgi:transposase
MAMSAVIGIDASKDQLALSEHAGRARLKNEPGILDRWASQLCPDIMVGVEATGRYHRPVLRALSRAGIRSYLLNPMRVSRYIRAMSPKVKTDSTDAVMIARYLEREHDLLVPYKMPTEQIQELKDLLSFRETLQEKKVALRQSMSEQTFKLSSVKDLEAGFKAALAEVDKKIKLLAQSMPLYEKLRKVDGIGPLGGAALTWVLSAFDFKDSDQCVSFLGIDVSVRESGKHKGKRMLTKRGPTFVRTSLFMGANSLRQLEELKPLFDHHKAKGLSATAVNIIVARKLVRIAFAIATKPGATFERKNLLPQLREKRENEVQALT